jgi:hypothetical protein
MKMGWWLRRKAARGCRREVEAAGEMAARAGLCLVGGRKRAKGGWNNNISSDLLVGKRGLRCVALRLNNNIGYGTRHSGCYHSPGKQ